MINHRKTNEENICFLVWNQSQLSVLLLASSVPQPQLNHVLTIFDVCYIIVEDSWDIVGRKIISCVAYQHASLSNTSISNQNEFYRNCSILFNFIWVFNCDLHIPDSIFLCFSHLFVWERRLWWNWSNCLILISLAATLFLMHRFWRLPFLLLSVFSFLIFIFNLYLYKYFPFLLLPYSTRALSSLRISFLVVPLWLIPPNLLLSRRPFSLDLN